VAIESNEERVGSLEGDVADLEAASDANMTALKHNIKAINTHIELVESTIKDLRDYADREIKESR
jgi:hypothetical protein